MSPVTPAVRPFAMGQQPPFTPVRGQVGEEPIEMLLAQPG